MPFVPFSLEPGRKALQGWTLQAVEQVAFLWPGADGQIVLPGRGVPGENPPFEPSTPALQGEACKVGKHCRAEAFPSHLGTNVKVFEVNPLLSLECGKTGQNPQGKPLKHPKATSAEGLCPKRFSRRISSVASTSWATPSYSASSMIKRRIRGTSSGPAGRITKFGMPVFTSSFDMPNHPFQTTTAVAKAAFAYTGSKLPHPEVKLVQGTDRNKIRQGMKVRVVQKQDQATGRLTEGIVRDLLTKSPTHPHGIKVRLENGIVGRVKELLD